MTGVPLLLLGQFTTVVAVAAAVPAAAVVADVVIVGHGCSSY